VKSWVIGGRGLLGSSVRDELLKSNVVWNQNMQIGWAKNNADQELEFQKASIFAAVNEFASIVKDSNWAIYWCAGIGVVSSPSEILKIEEIAMMNFLDALKRSNHLDLARGRIFYASSAGGVYALQQTTRVDNHIGEKSYVKSNLEHLCSAANNKKLHLYDRCGTTNCVFDRMFRKGERSRHRGFIKQLEHKQYSEDDPGSHKKETKGFTFVKCDDKISTNRSTTSIVGFKDRNFQSGSTVRDCSELHQAWNHESNQRRVCTMTAVKRLGK